MNSSNKYWKGIDELQESQDFVTSNVNEFAEGLPLEKIFSNDDSTRANRRDFLKTAAVAGAGAADLLR